MPIIPQLPPELIHIIVQNEVVHDRFTLYSLTLASKQFSWEATPHLYASMTDSKASIQLQFLRSILHNPPLALHVQKYHLPREEDTAPGQIWDAIREGLLIMVNLKELLIRRPFPNQSNNLLPIIETYQVSFQLEKFICLTSWPIFGSTDVTGFLHSQQNLKYLDWDTMPLQPPDILLANLTCISGPPHAIRHFLSSNNPCSIRYVSLRSNQTSIVPNTIELLQLEKLKLIHVLRITGRIEPNIFRYMYDQDFGGPFVHLRVLILSSIYSLKRSNLAQHFPALSELIFDPSRQMDLSVFTDQEIQEYTFKWFERCSTLLCVYIRHSQTPDFWRWSRGQSQPDPDLYSIPTQELLLSY